MSQKSENILTGDWKNLNNFFLKQFSILFCKIFCFEFVNELLIKNIGVYIYYNIYQYILVIYNVIL